MVPNRTAISPTEDETNAKNTTANKIMIFIFLLLRLELVQEFDLCMTVLVQLRISKCFAFLYTNASTLRFYQRIVFIYDFRFFFQ